MSSFMHPHFIYLFDLSDGRKKLAYGRSPQDALEILSLRLIDGELALILPDSCRRIHQREIHNYLDDIG